MSTRYIFFVILCTHSFLSLQGAAELSTRNLQNTQCLVCLQYFKVTVCSTFETSILESISSQSSFLCPGLLVLAPFNEKMWVFAIVVDQSSPGNIKVHLCNSHRLSTLHETRIRNIRPLLSFFWQSEQPKIHVIRTIKSFIKRFQKNDPKPHVEALCVSPRATIYVMGDIHGSSKSLLNFFKMLNLKNTLDDDLKLQRDTYLVFTGDYADRGSYGVRVWHMLCTLKLANPTQVFLIRGNHEILGTPTQKFYLEWQHLVQDCPKSANTDGMLESLFSALPQAVFLGVKDSHARQDHPTHHFLMFCHGGIDNSIPVRSILEEHMTSIQAMAASPIGRYHFEHAHPAGTGFLWNDFVAQSDEHEPEQSAISDRGPGALTFNSAAAAAYLRQQSSDNPKNPFEIDALFRGHQHIPGGISRLRKVRLNASDWVPLTHNTPEYIQQGSVYTCISSPEGLGMFNCCYDSFGRIEWTDTQWKLTPYIFERTPKKFRKKTCATQTDPIP